MKRTLTTTATTAALAALTLTGCGNTTTTESEAPTPSPTYHTSTPDPAQTTSAAPTEVTYRATSNLPASASWNGNNESHTQEFTDTFEVTIPLNGEYDYTNLTVNIAGEIHDLATIENAVLTCQTIINGEVVEEKTGNGISAMALCEYPSLNL